jgi:diguanylate cyclase (GGDEF)-like protein
LRPGVLIVEDDAIVALDLTGTLERLGYRIIGRYSSGADALTHMGNERPDLVLLDIHLRGPLDGIDVAERAHAFDIPTVFLTARCDEATLSRATRVKSYGYLLKPFREMELRSTIEVALARHAAAQDLQRTNDELTRRSSSAELRSETDELTGLHNRRGFFILGERILAQDQRAGHATLLVFADVDGLKTVNDQFGHPVGDAMLCDIARALRDTFRESDMIARLGGDEFAILVSSPALRLLELVSERFESRAAALQARQDRPYRLALSMGGALASVGSETKLGDLVAEADQHMYSAKRRRAGAGEHELLPSALRLRCATPASADETEEHFSVERAVS